MSKKEKYPEHKKLHAVKDESQAIGAFIDWMTSERKPTLQLCTVTEDLYHAPAFVTIEKLLAEYFEIDLDRLEDEKLAMLDEQRKLLGNR